MQYCVCAEHACSVNMLIHYLGFLWPLHGIIVRMAELKIWVQIRCPDMKHFYLTEGSVKKNKTKNKKNKNIFFFIPVYQYSNNFSIFWLQVMDTKAALRSKPNPPVYSFCENLENMNGINKDSVCITVCFFHSSPCMFFLWKYKWMHLIPSIFSFQLFQWH